VKKNNFEILEITTFRVTSRLYFGITISPPKWPPFEFRQRQYPWTAYIYYRCSAQPFTSAFSELCVAKFLQHGFGWNFNRM